MLVMLFLWDVDSEVDTGHKIVLLPFVKKEASKQKMQAIKEKMSDLTAMRKVKNEAKEEEKAEKELAKARVNVAREIRMAKEAESAIDLHVNKAAAKVAEQERKQRSGRQDFEHMSYVRQDSYGRNPNSPPVAYSNDPTFAAASDGAVGYSSDPTLGGGGAASRNGGISDPYAATYGRTDSVRSTETQYADSKSTM